MPVRNRLKRFPFPEIVYTLVSVFLIFRRHISYAFFMPETAQSLPPSTAAGFANLLSGLIASKSEAKSSDRWNDDALAKDVAILSYEQALRTHARYRPSSPPTSPDLADLDSPSSQQAPSAQQSVSAEPRSTTKLVNSLEESRKSASITIRLSNGECEQLRERASTAGLTVSAYLRSCVFEVESLRAQVKDTLAGLRSTQAVEPNPVVPPTRPAVRSAQGRPVPLHAAKSSVLGWLSRFLFPWHRGQRTADA
jgi:predicted DNA binding CopG/RHH family protein